MPELALVELEFVFIGAGFVGEVIEVLIDFEEFLLVVFKIGLAVRFFCKGLLGKVAP